jgi:outer membrane protein OmpA-like peptidoglycan-associated protein
MVLKRTLIAIAIVSMLAGHAAARTHHFIVFFATGSAHLGKKGHAVVEHIAAAAREQSGAKLVVAGYGDGATAADADLGERRAVAVAEALVKAGVEESRINRHHAAEAKGAGMPVHKVTVTLQSP